jgi:hypothetical protein
MPRLNLLAASLGSSFASLLPLPNKQILGLHAAALLPEARLHPIRRQPYTLTPRRQAQGSLALPRRLQRPRLDVRAA